MESHEESVPLSRSEKENRDETDRALGGPRHVCRFFSQGRHCNFGSKCRFLHQKGDVPVQGKLEGRTNRSRVEQERHRGTVLHSTPGLTPQDVKSVPEGDGGRGPVPPPSLRTGTGKRQGAGRRPCRYFLSGFCTMEDKCRFWHPEQLPLEDARTVTGGDGGKATRQRPPAPHPRPSALQEVKLCDLTDPLAKELRDTEIKQLAKRFPKERLIVQERSDRKVTFYRVTVEATDPDWPFDLKEIDVMVSFPEKYPQEVFTIDIPGDQELPSTMASHVQQASLEWLQAKHATNQLMGKVELLFRPFLRWLDRSLERLFTEGARQLKKDIEVARSGFQFVPYQQLQAAACREPGGSADTAGTHNPEDGQGEEEEEEEEEEGEEGEAATVEEKEEGDAAVRGDAGRVENVRGGDPRRGTEVKLLGLRLGEATATAVATQVTVCLQCSRCKVTADLTLNGRTPCSAQCEKCNAGISAAFRPSLLHRYCDVLGYLDLSNAAPVDLVLQDCQLAVGCLGCSKEGPVQNLSYGQSKDVSCQHCHGKLSILVDATRFQYIQPRSKDQPGRSALNYRRTVRDPAVQLGKPLPGKGACRHYKQSHRWLRFPCCGRAYACDVCHDEDQDHPMELATRMICGHCAKEQPFSNGKACVACGGMMTRGAHTSHWEGGLGCRSKVKMNRNDPHKYANTNKTISRKAASVKK